MSRCCSRTTPSARSGSGQGGSADLGIEIGAGTDVSSSLPILFRNSTGYQRDLTFTAKGVVVTETSSDPRITSAIREHAQEVSGFVHDGMPAMMRGMMGQ
jgi:hypothetical protein